MLFTTELIFILSEHHFIRFLLELILSFLSHRWNINFNSISIHRPAASSAQPSVFNAVTLYAQMHRLARFEHVASTTQHSGVTVGNKLVDIAPSSRINAPNAGQLTARAFAGNHGSKEPATSNQYTNLKASNLQPSSHQAIKPCSFIDCNMFH